MAWAEALQFAGTMAQASASIMGAKEAESQAKAQQALAGYNAQVSEANAAAARKKATLDQQLHMRAGQRAIHALRAKAGATGAMVSEGAPLEMLADQYSQMELENALIGYEGLVSEQESLSQARLDRLQGKYYGTQARNARQAGYLKTGATLLSGFANMHEEGMFTPSKTKRHPKFSGSKAKAEISYG